MAHLTEKRLREMEDEMNRFEEEILSTKAAAAAAEAAAAREARNNARKIIGAGTFNRMQAEIAHKASNPLVLSPKSSEEKSFLEAVVAGSLAPPPPPPPPFDNRSSITQSSGSGGFNLRPPPPPPPSFVPHQLHHRPMLPPRPPFPPRSMLPGPPFSMGMSGGGMPPMPRLMPPPPPPGRNMPGRPPGGDFMPNPMMAMSMRGNMQPFQFPQNAMQPPPAPSNGSSNQPTEKPKAVYAAPPMKRVVAETKPEKPKVAEIVVEPSEPHAEPAAKKQAVLGIELNVPVEEIEAEKKLNYYVPAAAPSVSTEAETAPSDNTKKKEKKKKFVRMAASTVWEDQTLAEWENDDFRLFCGDLGNEVTDETLGRAFNRYPTFLKAKVVRDKRTNKTKGFGFVSFRDPNDFMKAMREMNGKYVGNRPIKLRKSTWRDRQIDIVKKKDKEKKRLGFR